MASSVSGLLTSLRVSSLWHSCSISRWWNSPQLTGTVASTSSVPTVTDNLYKQGTIPTESIGIFYQPTTSTEEVANGEMTFGGTDDERCVLSLVAGYYKISRAILLSFAYVVRGRTLTRLPQLHRPDHLHAHHEHVAREQLLGHRPDGHVRRGWNDTNG